MFHLQKLLAQADNPRSGEAMAFALFDFARGLPLVGKEKGAID